MPYPKIQDGAIRKLFAIEKFKRSYSDHINFLMRKLYQNEGKWGKLLENGNYGVINTNVSLVRASMSKEIREFYVSVYSNTDPKWSLLNYVNTNYSSFAHVVDAINYWISTNQIKNEKLITFETNYFEELERLKKILNGVAKHIFMPDSNLNVFWRIMGTIATTTYIGNLSESITLASLSNLGNITDVVKSKPGQRVDTHGGVDISFKLNGINKKLQCKTFKKMFATSEKYIFSNISNPGEYKVDYFSFVNKKDIYVFDAYNNGSRYELDRNTQSFIFDRDLLKYKLEL
jgi:hypothetical protein